MCGGGKEASSSGVSVFNGEAGRRAGQSSREGQRDAGPAESRHRLPPVIKMRNLSLPSFTASALSSPERTHLRGPHTPSIRKMDRARKRGRGGGEPLALIMSAARSP